MYIIIDDDHNRVVCPGKITTESDDENKLVSQEGQEIFYSEEQARAIIKELEFEDGLQHCGLAIAEINVIERVPLN